MELVGNFSSFLLMVACSGNEIVVAKCGVLGVVAALAFGRQLMVPNFIFNIHTFLAIGLCFYIITYTTLRFNEVGWCFSVAAIAYFVYNEYRVGSIYALSRSLARTNPNSNVTHIVQG